MGCKELFSVATGLISGRYAGRMGALQRSLLLIALLVVVGGASLLARAQVRPATSEEPREGGAYRRPLGNDPATLDPAAIRDIYGLAVSQQIFDGLVQYDPNLNITPGLAQFWRASHDGLTWTFTLRKGVKFHNGREVTADDVAYSFTRILDPKTKSGVADFFLGIRGAQEFREGKAKQVSGLVAVDPHTVQVTLAEAAVPFVSVLAVGYARIVPKDIVERQGENFGSQPIGTGPFRFIRWERGKEIVLAANPDYFDGPPRLSRLVFRIFPGEQADQMYQEFRNGNLEDAPVPVRDYRQIIASHRYQYVRRPMFSIRHYGFNTTMRPLDDRSVRQAIMYAVDREGIVSDVFLGRYALARGILPPGTLGFNPKLQGYPYDPAKARELLAQAGYPEGRGLPPIQFWSSAKFEQVVQEHERMKRDLEHVGIRTEFHYLTDWPEYSKMMAERKFPAFLRAWFADVPDPENFLFKLFYSRSPWNRMGYNSSTVDDVLLQARSEPDPKRRVELYRRAEEMILADAPIMPVWHYTYERLFQPYVKSIEVNGLGDPYIPFRKVWLDRP